MLRGPIGNNVYFFLQDKHKEHLKRLKSSRDFYFKKKVRNCWRIKEPSGKAGTTFFSDIFSSVGSLNYFREQGDIGALPFDSVCHLLFLYLDLPVSSDFSPKHRQGLHFKISAFAGTTPLFITC